MITSGTGLCVGVVIAWVVLDQAGDADPSLAEDLGQLGKHAGPVGDRESEIIARPDLTGWCRERSQVQSSEPPEIDWAGGPARPVTTSIRSPTTAEAVGMAPAPRP